MNSSNFFIAFICTLMFINVCSALQCYVCNSRNNDKCDDNPDKMYLRNCTDQPHPVTDDLDTGYGPSQNMSFKEYIDGVLEKDAYNIGYAKNRDLKAKDFKYCKKSSQMIEKNIEIIRFCGWIDQEEECLSTTSGNIKINTCQCDTDDCNSAPKMPMNSIVSVLLALVMYVTIFH